MTQYNSRSKPFIAKVNNIEIAYETFGDPNASPLLLIMGLGYQMIFWDEEFCGQLAGHGYRVIRFDNRDCGLSTWLDDAGVPDIPVMKKLMAQRKTAQAPYSLRDMADDAAGLLDVLKIESAHIVGRSIGAMIGQMMTIHHPRRVKTLTSMMSSTSGKGLPPPKPEVLSILLEPEPTDLKGFVDHSVRSWRILSGPGFPIDEDRVRQWAQESYSRGLNPDGAARQFAAVIATGSRKEALKSVTAPTLVIHGDVDPLVPVECGIDTANAIPGARLLIIKGLGHTLVQAVYPQVIDAISRHAVDGE
jgi:pimeloyl-ACP methyl ester carboxylesterase